MTGQGSTAIDTELLVPDPPFESVAVATAVSVPAVPNGTFRSAVHADPRLGRIMATVPVERPAVHLNVTDAGDPPVMVATKGSLPHAPPFAAAA